LRNALLRIDLLLKQQGTPLGCYSELGKNSLSIVDQFSCDNFGFQAYRAARSALSHPHA
jgi:hypothetical protein